MQKRTLLHTRSAFSLVELSIVLVILGLLTGGILAGQSLIRAAELRSVSTDYDRYQTAVQTFRDKYFEIPGDMKTATKFWDSLGGTGADVNCAFTTPNGARTCNGSGDGTLMDYQNQTNTYSQEYGRFWQHLVNAGLVEGSFTGYPGTIAIGVNVAPSRIGNGAYFIARTALGYAGGTTSYPGDPYTFAGNYGKNMIALTNGGNTNTAGALVIKPEEAWNLDTKMDDGLPGSGKIIAYKGTGGTRTNCTDKANVLPSGEAGAQYLLNNSNKDCQLYFTNAF